MDEGEGGKLPVAVAAEDEDDCEWCGMESGRVWDGKMEGVWWCVCVWIDGVRDE